MGGRQLGKIRRDWRPFPIAPALHQRVVMSEGKEMAIWSCEIASKKEFSDRLRELPELIIVQGRLAGKLGQYSLCSVMDEDRQIHVVNRMANWSAIVLRRGARYSAAFCIGWRRSISTRVRENIELGTSKVGGSRR